MYQPYIESTTALRSHAPIILFEQSLSRMALVDLLVEDSSCSTSSNRFMKQVRSETTSSNLIK